MNKNIDNLTLHDLVQELAPATLNHYSGLKDAINWNGISPLMTKFVRLGSRIFVAPAVQYGPIEENPLYGSVYRKTVRHYDMALHVSAIVSDFDRTTISADVKNENAKELGDIKGLVDAGWMECVMDKVPAEIYVMNDSFELGKGNEAVRNRTVALAQAVMGETVQVVNHPYTGC
jgi:hypothetical protein